MLRAILSEVERLRGPAPRGYKGDDSQQPKADPSLNRKAHVVQPELPFAAGSAPCRRFFVADKH